jgi:hypothetical protein
MKIGLTQRFVGKLLGQSFFLLRGRRSSAMPLLVRMTGQ